MWCNSKSHSCREVSFNCSGNNICCWSLGSNNHMNSHSTGFLRNSGYRHFNLLTCSHNKISKLINNYYNIGHKPMTVVRVKPSVFKLIVILFNCSYMCLHKQLIPVVHLFCERVKCLSYFSYIHNYWFIFIR